MLKWKTVIITSGDLNKRDGAAVLPSSSSSSLKNSSLSLAEWDFFISAFRFRGIFRLRDGEKKEGRFLSGVGGVLKDVTWTRVTFTQEVKVTTCRRRSTRFIVTETAARNWLKIWYNYVSDLHLFKLVFLFCLFHSWLFVYNNTCY